jgi:sialate O-acetylesterase
LTLLVAFASTLLASIAPAAAESLPLVSPIFGDNMVLQRDKPNTLWGWSQPGREIRVEVAGVTATAVTGADGRWQVRIQPPAVGGPYTIRIVGPRTLELHEILVGDVWLCGGQSNMELGLGRARDGAAEIRMANHPEIRLFKVSQQVSYSSAGVVPGAWKICSPATVAEGGNGGFSAVAYFFARRLENELHVPIGLIQDAVGGTPVETWMNPDTLSQMKDFKTAMAEVARLRNRGGREYGNYIMHWYDEYDAGGKGNTWAAPTLDDTAWKPVRIPGGFRELEVADAPAVCWFRKVLALPDPLPPGPARIYLGVIEKMDTTYLNGRWIGASSWVENPRVYAIPDGTLRPGQNVLTVRVFKLKPDGGFESPAETLRLVLGDGTVIPLAGAWKGAVSVDCRPPHEMPLGFENYPTIPSVLYRGMIAPLAPLAMTGVLWYQGEANASRAFQYRTLLPAMIDDWRRLFDQGELPFYVVSLPAYMHRRDVPGDDPWAELREAQALTARQVRHVGLAVTIDTGDPDNIHPQDKQVVGERLALCALSGTYGRDICCEGPVFASAERLPGALKLHFNHADGGLVARGGKAEEFAVAGPDRKWHWAEARVDGDSVVVSSAQVPQPVAARYAWQANPAATLFNGAGLPAAPFRTDDWPGITEGRASP